MGGSSVPRKGRMLPHRLMTAKQQLAAACADPPQTWSRSSPPPNFGVPSRPTSAQGAPSTRKSRATASSSLNQSSSNSRSNSPLPGNDAYFERLGNTNASRPNHLPPSQGGRYGGFGSTPETETSPSFATSSHSVPTLDELQRNPLGALSKGWGLFSNAVATAGKEINDSVVKPGMSRAQELTSAEGSEEWKRYLSQAQTGAVQATGWLGQRANEGWTGLNEVAKTRGGVDLNEQLGKLGMSGKTSGYGQLERAEDGVISPPAVKDDDFFEDWNQQAAAASKPATAPKAKGKDEWDEW